MFADGNISAKVTFGMMTSLDGYINDREGGFDWGHVSSLSCGVRQDAPWRGRPRGFYRISPVST
ncbi:hypothetical protein D187_009497 [Cystobacter fuscus DSM 2262]|uniref:Uncharacterized protein n=1 Tax=Cystobacter fuscus (strain ATCC 25194 / DSM 2262 / NBRC 100088 / M29) TaxID=1242864 RepID=S9QFZ3_CYSF2|nr:hypothetical protein D187_009497 [Cystobacter fuscus DSM 2262]